MKPRTTYFSEGQVEPTYVPLRHRLAIGRVGGTTRSQPFQRQDQADVALLQTHQAAIAVADGTQCQLLIERWNNDFIAKDCNPNAYTCQLNGRLLTETKLVINDRLTLGDGFHFHFDGAGLTRVPERQGGLIEARQLTKIYEPGLWSRRRAQTVALRNVSLTIQPNEFVGVIGPSGGGKSTLIKLLCGALAPTRGQVTINGLDISEHPELVRSVVGLVPQDDIVHPELTVWDAVFTSACLRLPSKINHQAKRLHVETVLARLRLWEARHRRVRELSGGQRKRVSIAIEILKKSSVLFLDEPSSGLDPSKEEELMMQLREMAEQGRTIVCTTHVVDRDFLFNKVCIVARGDVVYFGPPEEAPSYFEEKTMLDVYRLLDDPHYLPVPWGSTASSGGGDQWDTAAAIRTSARHPEGEALLKEASAQPDELGMQLVHFTRGGVVVFPGQMDPSDMPSLVALAAYGPDTLVLDFHKLAPNEEFLSAELMVQVHAELSRRGGGLALVHPPESLLEVLRVHRCLERIRTFDDLGVAVRETQLGLLVQGTPSFFARLGPVHTVLGAVAILMVAGLGWLVWMQFFSN